MQPRPLFVAFAFAVLLLSGGDVQAAQPAPKPAAELAALRARAAKGEAAAQFDLSQRILNGETGSMDGAEALRLCRAAAEQGHVQAQFALGCLLADFQGKRAEAIGWWRKAAEKGDVGSQFNLGNAYRLGNGVERDAAEAAKWYRKAAEQGHPYAQFSLGLALSNGDGVKKDLAEAIAWYRKSAEGGADKAQFNLGNAYWNGVGAPQDYAEAAKWYRKAAEQGMAAAQLNLAECLLKGYGQPKDIDEACAWLLLAQDRNATARAALQMVVMQSDISDERQRAIERRAAALAKEIEARPAPRGWSK